MPAGGPDPVRSCLPTEEPDTAYSARLFAQLYLPYRDPGDVPRWSRTNGAVTLTVRPGEWKDPKTGEYHTGYPYGALPRLLLTWMTGEALRTERPVLEAGHSLYGFLGRIGLNPPGDDGRRWRTGGSDARRLLDQMRRLFSAPFTVYDERDPTWHASGAFFVTEWVKAPANGDHCWGAQITLSDRFFEAVMGGSVPLDAKGLRKLQGSPLRLDIYAWLAHRLGYLKRPTTIRWEDLAAQFGGEYERTRDFKRQFLRQLAVVLRDAYPQAKVEPADKGLVLRPSKEAVPRSRATK